MTLAKRLSPALLIGLFATIVFTIVIHVVPLLGFKKVDLSREIANRFFGDASNVYLIGHAIHYSTGTLLSVFYILCGRGWIVSAWQSTRFEASGFLYGTVWSLGAFVISILFLLLIDRYNLVVTSGTLTLLFAHLVYGSILGGFLDYEDNATIQDLIPETEPRDS